VLVIPKFSCCCFVFNFLADSLVHVFSLWRSNWNSFFFIVMYFALFPSSSSRITLAHTVSKLFCLAFLNILWVLCGCLKIVWAFLSGRSLMTSFLTIASFLYGCSHDISEETLLYQLQSSSSIDMTWDRERKTRKKRQILLNVNILLFSLIYEVFF
jgi:hypothetical protein